MSQASAVTRSPETEQRYLARALWFEGYVAAEMKTADVSPIEVVAWAIECKSKWSASTWRQMKASLKFRYESMNTPEALTAALTISYESQSGTVKRSKKTSGARKKRITDAELAYLLETIQRRRSKYAPILHTWLRLGALVGLRPHEWGQATVLYLSDADVHGKGSALNKEPYLRIENAKNTNGRSHGQYRHLNIAKYSQQDIDDIATFAMFMTSVHSNGEYPIFYSGCQSLLGRINIKLTGGRGKRMQLYSVRHKFSSDAKRSFTLEEVAALMGHATDKTASFHYGRKRDGGGGLGVRPLGIEVARVKRLKKPVPEVVKQRNTHGRKTTRRTPILGPTPRA